ncbi:MAG: tRNA pseudouridine(55) synthase TruB [Flavobacteriales bacterium]|nr:tRNA pseudouridine(55) synthase TruB [Flavobacteriales bacterium]
MSTLEEYQQGKIILIDKSLDWTSFSVVKKIRYTLQKKFTIKKLKVGHAGTLDPKATGLLILATGKFTKKIAELQETTKVYTGTIKLGVQTPSYDTETKEILPKEYSHITQENIEQTVQHFTGEINQIPPMYSALKRDGVRMFDLARKGIETEIPSRKITIYNFIITSISLPYIDFEVTCSKGTYIRSLAKDVGDYLGCGGYLTALRRTKSGDFSVEDALTVEEFIDKLN